MTFTNGFQNKANTYYRKKFTFYTLSRKSFYLLLIKVNDKTLIFIRKKFVQNEVEFIHKLFGVAASSQS